MNNELYDKSSYLSCLNMRSLATDEINKYNTNFNNIINKNNCIYNNLFEHHHNPIKSLYIDNKSCIYKRDTYEFVDNNVSTLNNDNVKFNIQTKNKLSSSTCHT